MAAFSIHIPIDRTRNVPLFRQIYEKIRDDILTGMLPPGTCLPATRRLAKELKISRNAVMEAYAQLAAEGYITAGSGTYTRVAADTRYHAYRKTGSLRKKDVSPPSPDVLAFKTGIPDLRRFPRTVWGRCLKRAAEQAGDSELAYSDPAGHWGFRETLCEYLYRSRGIRVAADQVVVTSGATQALFLAARVLAKPDAGSPEAVLEDPGGYGVMEILRTAGYRLNPIPVTGAALDPDRLPLHPETRLIYVTPSHQFPMGRIMPAATRIRLLERMEDGNSYIVEDDYDSEFRYTGAPIHPLKALAPDRVIYIGSFSKVLSPALRIGYAVVPPSLLARFRHLKQFTDAQSPLLDQIALAAFIRDGGFERHVYQMKKIYTRRRNALVSSLEETFGPSVRIFGENAGLHLVAEFPDARFDLTPQYEVCHNGILVQSVSRHAIRKQGHGRQLVFGYGHLSEREIRRGIAALKSLT